MQACWIVAALSFLMTFSQGEQAAPNSAATSSSDPAKASGETEKVPPAPAKKPFVLEINGSPVETKYVEPKGPKGLHIAPVRIGNHAIVASTDTPGAGELSQPLNDQWLSLAVLLLGAAGAFALAYLRLKDRLSERAYFKLTGLWVVLLCGTFLLMVGYDEKQSGPMMGLLGTVAGYILGRPDESDEERVTKRKG